MSISIILAMDKNRVIGVDNRLPWRLPAELAYFKKVTMGHAVLMGRKTHESIGRPLPGRVNVVMTRDRSYEADGCVVVHSTEEALERLPADDESFVIGGADMLHLFMPLASKMYITMIDHAFEGDTFFPEIDERIWRVTSRAPGVTDENNPFKYEYLVYERIAD